MRFINNNKNKLNSKKNWFFNLVSNTHLVCKNVLFLCTHKGKKKKKRLGIALIWESPTFSKKILLTFFSYFELTNIVDYLKKKKDYQKID